MITTSYMMLDGVSVEQGTGYKDGSGNIRPGLGWVSIGADGTARQASLVAAITDTPTAYVFAKTVVAAGDRHVTGTVVPVSAMVHLSAVSGNLTPEALLDGEIGYVQPDDTGAWACDVHLDASGLVYAWITIALPIDSATSASVLIDQEPDEPDEPEDPDNPEPEEPRAYTISVDIGAVPNILNNATQFTFAATVSGPADLANIKLYAWDMDTGEYLLMPSSVSEGNGEYALNASWDRHGTPYDQFRVQAGTDDASGVLAVNVMQYEALCLSGDTRITLADGTERRLDELTGGELVLGGDLRPARILRLARGMWSDRHTLYHFDDGTTIDEIHEHRFYDVDQGFWQKLKCWRIGDRARHLDGGTPALVAVEPVEERAEMFGIWVERGSYWANGLLSGDASANRPLLADATAEQAADMAASLDERAVERLFGGGAIL